MFYNKILYICLIAGIFLNTSCQKELVGKSAYYTENPFEDYELPVPEHDGTLRETEGWSSDTLDQGLIHYTYSRFYQGQNANQNVNVVELDLNNQEYEIEVIYLSALDSLSKVAERYDAVIGINGTYEIDASFIKTNGNIHSQVTLPEDHLRYWKHEGALMFDTNYDVSIGYGTNSGYLASSSTNILSGAPILIENGESVGETFIGDVTGINLNDLEGEDYRRHQGVRHPRTAIALTSDNKLLMITVDGRASQAEGMNARELTQFLTRYFAPKDALNIDGGGSTTMFVKGSGRSSTDVVNYPTDNGSYDHYGQRRVRSFILVKKRDNDSEFDGGDGTEANPFLIATANQLQNMHGLDWSNTQANPYYFKLTADINMMGRNWTPLNNIDPYERFLHFDGNGHIIKNLKVAGGGYASLFGVLVGSCKNLGLVDVDIENAGSNGIGAFAGYLGIRSPAIPEKTGRLENCFSTGRVVGRDAVGGLIGNVGGPNGEQASTIVNCFSAAEVTAMHTGTNNSRAGGIAGIIYTGGIIQDCFASGRILSNTESGRGAGGVIGWTDSKISGLVSFSPDIRNVGAGHAGRISAAMGRVSGTIVQCEDCWASEDVVVYKNNAAVPASSYVTGVVTAEATAYDGETKSKAFLSDINNYSSILGWELGPQKPWASTVNSKGYPILQWLFLRGDYEDYY